MASRYWQVSFVVGVCLLLHGGSALPAMAGDNPAFTLPMHVAYGFFSDCSGYLPVDCLENRPTVNIFGNVNASVFLSVANYQNLTGVQAAIQWSSPSWHLVFGIFDCLPGQRLKFKPSGNTASGATLFDCVKGPALAVFAMMFFQVGGSGCVQFIQPQDPLGIFVQDCQGAIDQIMEAESPRLGRVCVGAGGFDACDPVEPVESMTWGAIKASFLAGH